MNGAECLLRTLLINGVNVCFMNPGTSEMQFVSALDRVPEMRGVLCLVEGVCSGAADGYARMLGKPASTLLHLGPGLANALSNFHNARKARSPVISIVGEHSTQHLPYNAPLTADIPAFARTVSNCVRVLETPDQMGPAASAAVEAALRPPGQISTLIIPADFSWSPAGSVGERVDVRPRSIPGPEKIRHAASILRSEARVGILLGGSSLLRPGLLAAGKIGAASRTLILADRNAARYERGCGLFAPKRIPYFPEPANDLLAGLAHLILVETQPPVSFFGYPGQRSLVAPEDCEYHVLASPEENGAAALEMLAAELGADAPPAETPPSNARSVPEEGPLTPSVIGQIVAAMLPEGAIISDEMVSSSEAVWPHLGSALPHSHLPVTGGSIGQGLPVALGAAIACPDRKVVALEADGSAMYSLQALWTIARENLDVTVVIFANRRYRILDVERERTKAGSFGPRANDMIDIGRPDIDFVLLAKGLGIPATRVDTSRAFAARFRLAMEERGPSLIEAVLCS
ncbi:MAG: acetolactate synthase large subunit [Bryobacteraceae bacterium]|nr:acetolactate synthase large subunit [Bryobacteraceae bacterium]